ncbi:hypothetical protein Tco_0725863 [Tanacetum coccineum]|uniref:Uncharacterized protein n=1 Tax=Tanacetum coccineum TaxID=301880 RepID=A0ABQ4YGB8_9ASTR
MSKPLPLQDKEGRLIIPVEFFFNNDLEYLKAGNKERSYSSSITKTPAARYTLEGIEDMIPTLWSPFIIAYDKDAAFRISHQGPQCQLFYRVMINQKYKHEVFSTMRILSVVSVKVEKKSGYGYLEEIVVSRADQKLYKFKEGDFPDLHLNDIEDMLLLIAQNKLFNLDGDVTVDFVTSLKMFTRGIIVKNMVEDVQLGIITTDIYDARFDHRAFVAEMIDNGQWKWQNDWNNKFPLIYMPMKIELKDVGSNEGESTNNDDGDRSQPNNEDEVKNDDEHGSEPDNGVSLNPYCIQYLINTMWSGHDPSTGIE